MEYEDIGLLNLIQAGFYAISFTHALNKKKDIKAASNTNSNNILTCI